MREISARTTPLAMRRSILLGNENILFTGNKIFRAPEPQKITITTGGETKNLSIDYAYILSLCSHSPNAKELYSCWCLHGFTGPLCKEDEMAEYECRLDKCSGHGRGRNGETGLNCSCECDFGYTGEKVIPKHRDSIWSSIAVRLRNSMPGHVLFQQCHMHL